MSTYDRVETDNPLLDEIVYNCKLMMRTCILKDEHTANRVETLESMRNADIYRMIKEGTIKYFAFDYTKDDMLAVAIPDNNINKYLNDPKSMPDEYKQRLLDYRSKLFMENYEETNPYYRKLSGLPNSPDEYVYLTKDQMNKIGLSMDISKPVHAQPIAVRNAIVNTGIIDELKAKYPKFYYLKHINKELDPYIMRKVPDLGLIYVDTSAEPILVSRFKELIDKNRVYILKTMGEDAYRYYSTYYDRFLMMMVVVQTICDMVTDMSDYYIRRDVFDIRTCEYFFDAYDVEFFPEIPLKYQKKLVQNLNRLIKYKATDKNILDICSIFGFKDIQVFKYYLCKDHKTDPTTGKYLPLEGKELSDVYDLRFIKVPIEESVADYIKDETASNDYDTITLSDKYWDGPYSHEEIKRKLLEKEFNIVESKYLSIDNTYSLTEMSFEFVYFINMLMFTGVNVENINLTIPTVSVSAKLNILDVMMYMYALMYLYQGVEDFIIDAPSMYLKIMGFNFDVDLAEVAAYIADRGYTLEDLGVKQFSVPADKTVFSIGEMVKIFINNKEIYDHVSSEMYKVDTKEQYECYKKIFDSYFTTELNYKYFYIEELGRQATSYSEYLKYNSSVLYESLNTIKDMPVYEDRQAVIINSLNAICDFIVQWINNEEIQNIFVNLPVESGNSVMAYMYKIINFFKSYKVTLLDVNNIYKIDEERVFIIDDYYINYIFNKNEVINAIDYIYDRNISLTIGNTSDSLILVEDLLEDITRNYEKKYKDDISKDLTRDKVHGISAYLFLQDTVVSFDGVESIDKTTE